jgi:hypothetical protein
MVCTTCGLDNDPRAYLCARCNSALSVAPPPRQDLPVRGRNWSALTAGLSIFVLLVLVAGFILYRHNESRPSTAPPPATTTSADPTNPAKADPATGDPATGDPATVPRTPVAAADPAVQARAIDAVLDQSGTSRDKLNRAIGQVSSCADPAGALADMRAVADERRSQLATVRSADLSALENGDTLRTDLVAALQQSLNADQSFMEWAAPAAAGSCGSTAARRAAYASGRSASDRAGTAKQRFLDEWNPVATPLGLPARSRSGI